MEYRKAEAFDVAVLAKMRVSMLCEDKDYNEVFRATMQNNTTQYIMQGLHDQNYVAWVAVLEGLIVAMGGINFFALPPNDWCPNGKTGYIGNMYTLPGFLKHGIATKLLAFLVEEAKVRGCQRVLLNTTDQGRHLYETVGFATSETAMALYPFGILPSL